MGLGLTDDDIHHLQDKADKDKSGVVTLKEFLHVGTKLLKDHFQGTEWY